MPYAQSKDFLRQLSNPPKLDVNLYLSDPTLENRLLEFIIQHADAGSIDSAIKNIDNFANKDWMMNLGPEKGLILTKYLKYKQINKILEIGGYCGYSALTFASILPNAQIHTIQKQAKYAEIANKIQQHAGVADRIHIHVGVVSTLEQQIKQNGPYDLIFIDHEKTIYLQDFLTLEKYGIIKKGCVVIGDNIITPGSPDYLAHFKQNQEYDSVLEHSYIEYCDIPDAVLISERLTDAK